MKQKRQKIALLGAGSWGTAVAHLLGTQGHEVLMWARESDIVESINHQHRNSLYHPEEPLSPNIRCSLDLDEVVGFASILVLAIPTQFIRKILAPIADKLGSDKILVNLAKGIERDTLLTGCQMLRQIQPRLTDSQLMVLSGPSFSEEVLRGKPTAVTLACKDLKRGKEIQQVFHAPHFWTYLSEDVTGVELGGAIKNVIAIGVGTAEGLGFGLNARAGLITRSLAEMKLLAEEMGADPNTLSGLSGIGDLILTCTGDLSRNRTLGLRLARGETLKEVLAGSRTVAEGVPTTKSAFLLAQKHGVEMPIVEQVYRGLYEGKAIKDAVHDLLHQDPSVEFAHA